MTNVTAIRDNAPDPADAPASGRRDRHVVSGKATGEVVRSIFDGGTAEQEAHIAIDGHNGPLADVTIQTDDAEALRDLSVVAAFPANELGTTPTTPPPDTSPAIVPETRVDRMGRL
jgi:hypothetical protein